MKGILVEACVEGVEASTAAERAGADRLELCAGLVEDGTTPSAGTLAAVRARVKIPIVAMIRPRGGSFVYTSAEVEVMERDIAAARAAGADGVALGVLDADGRVDEDVLRSLVRLASPMRVTFHRAFDAAAELPAALDALVAAGVNRVLTSGGAPSALDGAATLESLVRQAGGRVTVVAGGRVDAAAVQGLVRAGVRELHVGNDPRRLAAVIAAAGG